MSLGNSCEGVDTCGSGVGSGMGSGWVGSMCGWMVGDMCGDSVGMCGGWVVGMCGWMMYGLSGMKFRIELLPTVIPHVLGTVMVSFAISAEEKSKMLWFLPLH